MTFFCCHCLNISGQISKQSVEKDGIKILNSLNGGNNAETTKYNAFLKQVGI